MDNPLQLSFVNFKKGAYIIVEGKQNADRFFIIRSGHVRVSKEVEVVEEDTGNMLGPGDFFGVIATMSSHNHIETAQAMEDCVVISVYREQFGLLIERNTPVAMKIIMAFSRKMRYLDEALMRQTNKNHMEADPSFLFKLGEFYAKQSQYNLAYYSYYQYLKFVPSGPEAATARDRLMKIQPYSHAVYLDGSTEGLTRYYPKDTMIFSECMPGSELYIIQKGSVKITKLVGDSEVLLAVLKPGDIFGEMSILENKPRSANAIANDDAYLLAVNKANFEGMVKTQPQIVTRLTTLLSERLWFIYKQLANTIISDPLGRVYDTFSMTLEKNRVTLRAGGAFVFDYGPKELQGMIGLTGADGNLIVQRLLENNKFKIVDNKFHVSDLAEIEKQCEYFRKMTKIDRSRRESQGAH
jgi:CRP-like cAMP-binding protein